jgi:glycosyltransferase involved in cell wall biosynthesis
LTGELLDQISLAQGKQMDISVVLPVYNEREIVIPIYRALCSSLEQLAKEYEIIFVDDGSADGTAPEILNMAKSDPRLIVVELTRNFGNAMAIAMGLEFASGDWVVTMDSDFEDRPEHIGELYKKAREGYDVVYAVRESKQKSFLKHIGSQVFYFLMSRISSIPLPPNMGNFCIMRQEVVRALRKMSERTRYFAGIRTWVGFTQVGLDLPRGKRLAGSPKQSFPRLIKHAMDAVVSFSTVPLRLLTVLGTVAIVFALLAALRIIVLRLTRPEVQIEWALTIMAIIFVGGIQLLGLGILGAYLGRIYDEVRGRPVAIIKKLTNAKAKIEP